MYSKGEQSPFRQFQTLETDCKSGKILLAQQQQQPVLLSQQSPIGFRHQNSETGGGLKLSSVEPGKCSVTVSSNDQSSEIPRPNCKDCFTLDKLAEPEDPWLMELQTFEGHDSDTETAELLESLFESYPENIVDVHDSNRPVLYRHFVEGLIRVAFLYLQENPTQFHSLIDAAEYVLEGRVIRRVGRSLLRSKQEDQALSKAEKIFMHYEQKLRYGFEHALGAERRHGSTLNAQLKDVTVNGLEVLKLLVEMRMLDGKELEKFDFKNWRMKEKINQKKRREYMEEMAKPEPKLKGECPKLLGLVDALRLIEQGVAR